MREHKDNNQNNQELEIVDIDDEAVPNRGIFLFPQRLLALVPHQRRIQMMITVSLVVLVLIALLGSNVSVRGKFIQAVVPPSPTPIPPIVRGTDNFYASGDVGWGHLFLDSKPIMNVPDAYTNTGVQVPPIHLTRGAHKLQWQAAPFPSQECTVSVPNNYRTDTCKYNNFSGNAWGFNFPAGLDELSAPSRNALIAITQNALQAYTSSDIVQRGEQYTINLTSQQQATAQEPLKVTLHYELDTDISSSLVQCSPFNFAGEQGCIIGTQDCRTFCIASTYFNAGSSIKQTWNVFAAAHPIWDYTTLAGRPIVQHLVDRVNATLIDQLIPLQISWDGVQWHVKSSFSLVSGYGLQSFASPVCDLAGFSEPVAADEQQAMANWNYVGSDAVMSCLIIATLDASQVPHPPPTPAMFLYRFGVFLAANDVAHHYWPSIQLADPYAQQLAQQLYKSSIQHGIK